MVVDVDAMGEGFLVVMDTVVDDFTAKVDGEVVEILDADHAGGMVQISEGLHTVELDYTPRGLRTGALVSAVAALTLLLGGVGWWRTRQTTLDEKESLQVPRPASAS